MMAIEIQRMPPTRFPVCIDCGHEIDSHTPGCDNPMRGRLVSEGELQEWRGQTASAGKGPFKYDPRHHFPDGMLKGISGGKMDDGER